MAAADTAAARDVGVVGQSRRFDRLIAQSPLSTQVFGPDGQCRQVNAAWQKMWGGSLSDALAYNILEDEQLVEQGIMPLVRRVFEGEAISLPLIPYTPVVGQHAGEVRWCSAEMFPVKDADGRVEEAVLIHNDLTAHKRLEAELAEQVEFRNAIERSLSSGIATVDDEGRHTYVSETFCRMVGWSREELIGTGPPYVYWPPEEAPALNQRMVQMLAAEFAPQSFEARLCRRNGERFDALFTCSPLLDGRQRRIGWLAAVEDIAQRKGEQEALRVAVERWELAVNATRDGIWDWNPETDELYWSPRCKQMLGYDDSVPSTRKWVADLLHPDDRESSWAATQRHLAGETPHFELEYRLRHADGSYRWILCRGVAVRNAQGQPVRMIGSHTDISDRVESQRALQQAEERLRLGLKAGRIGTWDWDIARNHVVWSERLYEIHGLSREEFGGTVEDFSRLIHPADRERVQEVLSNALANGSGYELEFRTIRPNGEIRWLSTAGEVYFDAEGRAVRMLGATTDVTERRQMEQALRDSEERFRVALKNTSVSVYTNDADLRYTWVYNPRWGYSPEDVLGRRDGELLPMETIAELVEMKRRVMTTGKGERRQISTRVGGATFVFDATVEPLVAEDGRVTGVTVASMDVTDVMNAKRAAEEASRAKDQFLAVLSHELRTPLTPVLLTLSLVESRSDLPDEVRADLAAIRRNVELESRLISDLLDLTRIGRGKLQLDMQDVDLHLIIRSAIDICQREVSARLVADLAATRYYVRGDSTRLQQIFWNLISNSQKFTAPDGQITVRSRDAEGGRIVVEVSDTGAGIDPAVLPRLFDAFEQGEVRADRQQAGLGLGLAISRKLAEAHGGTISATSGGRGKGATFAVELPVQPRHPQPQRPVPRGRLDRSAQKLSVLLIEDHEPTLRAMVRLLGQLGHAVTPVASAAGALAAARQGTFDVIISDLGLPDGSGLDVMRQLRSTYGRRAIALTGYGMESDVQASRDAGFSEHLTKPVDFETLEEAIRRVTGP